MKKNKLGNTGIEVSEIGFGVLTVGGSQLNLPVKKGAEIIMYALERGINFLDTAQYYNTYSYIKEALKGQDYNPVICSRSLDWSYKDMEYAIEEARRELNRDIIDIFMLHEVRSPDDFRLRSGAFQCLLDYKAKGTIKATGVSTHHVDVAFMASKIKEIDTLFPLINFRSLGIRKGDGPGEKEEMAKAIKMAADAGKGVFAMKALGGGVLAADYVEAMDYVTGLPGVNSTVLGFGSIDEVDTVFDYIEARLPGDYKPDLSHKRIFIDQGDCEGCQACYYRCPNDAIFINKAGLAEINYDKCLTCGYCAPVCPVRAIIML